MAKSDVERPFDDGTEHRQKRGSAARTRRTLSEGADRAAERRAEARRLGRHPTPATEGRSRNMQAIRRTNTKPELAIRSALHRLGYRFRKNYRIKVEHGWVRPDIVFTRQKVAIFVDGCFWHGCPEHGRTPSVNDWYWSPKLRQTQERDRRNSHALVIDRWQVIRIWEHEPLDAAVRRVEAAISGGRHG